MSRLKHIIGIDPGKGGGIGRMIMVDRPIWSAYKCPNTLDEMVDEVYGYEKIERDSYWDGICCKDDDPDDNRNLPTREEYNKKWEENFETYHQMYVKNGNKILIL